MSTPSSSAVQSYIEGVDRLLAWDVGAESSLELAVAADPDFALGHAALAVVRYLRGEASEARASAERAAGPASGVGRRARQHVATVAALVAGRPAQALALARAHLAEYPRDALILLLALFLIARSGEVDWPHQWLALLDVLERPYGDDWWFLGVYAFAHEELGRFEEARLLAERSLAINPRNAGAAHPLVHVHYELGEHTSGTAFLGDWLAGYDRAAPYHCHLAWHLALYALADGRADRALKIYEDAIGPVVETARTALADAASLLWRLGLAGRSSRPLPWADVCRLASRARPGLSMADAHAALAFAATGDEVALARLIDGLMARARQGHPLAKTVALPLVEGVAAFGRGAYVDAARSLEPVMGQLVRIGGTHAQRQVFEETLLVAHLRAGHVDRAEALVRGRLARRPSAADLWWVPRAG